MKKILTIILLIASAQSFSQTTKIFNTLYNDGASFGKKDTEVVYTTPKTPLFYFNAYGNFVALNTDSIGVEGAANLWFTNARSRSAISLTTTGTSGAATYNSSTGVLNIPQYSGGGGSGWNLTGNSGITPITNYIGINDASSDFRIVTNGQVRAAFDSATGRVMFNGLSTLTNATDSATIQTSPRGISFRRADGVTRGTSIGLDAGDNFRIQGNNSGIYYKEGSTTEFSVTGAGVGFFNNALSSTGKISSTLNSGVNGDFYASSGGAQFNLPNNVQVGGTGFIYSTQTSGPTNFGLKFNSYDGTAYQDRWWIQQNGAYSSTATTVPSALLNVSSTTRGFLPPVQTTTQVNASGISTGTLVGGSGYTNGTYNKYLTGGSGSGFYATITISGGSITGVGAIYEGAGYVVNDVLSASGIGAGTGFTYTVTAITTPATGLMKYNSTTNTNNTYNGTNWTGQFVSSSAGTLTLTHGTDYVFTGTTATYTLPAISSTLLGRQNAIKIKNRGSGTITLNAASGSTIYSTSAVSTINIIAGAACELMPDGTYFLVMVNQ